MPGATASKRKTRTPRQHTKKKERKKKGPRRGGGSRIAAENGQTGSRTGSGGSGGYGKRRERWETQPLGANKEGPEKKGQSTFSERVCGIFLLRTPTEQGSYGRGGGK